MFGGEDVKSFSQSSLRQAMGVVPQDTVLFNDTIKWVRLSRAENDQLWCRYNIKYGNMDATDAEVEEAAILADIHDTILEFPDKVEQQLRQPETLFCAPSCLSGDPEGQHNGWHCHWLTDKSVDHCCNGLGHFGHSRYYAFCQSEVSDWKAFAILAMSLDFVLFFHEYNNIQLRITLTITFKKTAGGPVWFVCWERVCRSWVCCVRSPKVRWGTLMLSRRNIIINSTFVAVRDDGRRTRGKTVRWRTAESRHCKDPHKV